MDSISNGSADDRLQALRSEFLRRDVKQQRRIVKGIQSGELTPEEVGSLELRAARIWRMENEAAEDGVISRGEQRRIERAQRAMSRGIHRLAHNDLRVASFAEAMDEAEACMCCGQDGVAPAAGSPQPAGTPPSTAQTAAAGPAPIIPPPLVMAPPPTATAPAPAQSASGQATTGGPFLITGGAPQPGGTPSAPGSVPVDAKDIPVDIPVGGLLSGLQNATPTQEPGPASPTQPAPGQPTSSTPFVITGEPQPGGTSTTSGAPGSPAGPDSQNIPIDDFLAALANAGTVPSTTTVTTGLSQAGAQPAAQYNSQAATHVRWPFDTVG